ncbi:MAG: GNAT family N-acetyltransferase [Deinococcota bacterium]
MNIQHNPEKNQFEAQTDAGTAVLVYMKVGDTLIFHHTEVPEALEGQGIGSQLAKFGLEYVRENNITAAALCPFVKGYVAKHPEYQSLVKLRS